MNFILKCSCGWVHYCNGTAPELKSFKEVFKGCKTCGKPRTFLCPKCKKIVKMIRTIK